LRTVYIDLDQKIRLTCGNSKQQATGKELMAEISFSGVGKIILLQESNGRERRPLWIPITRLCPTAPTLYPVKSVLLQSCMSGMMIVHENVANCGFARDQCDVVQKKAGSLKERMMAKPEELLPSATDLMQKIALAEAEEASEQMRARTEAEAEKKALLDQLTKPSGISDEEAVRRATAIIERAVRNRLTEVQVYRFPNKLCTDKRARHQSA
jgi:hypothetical protein